MNLWQSIAVLAGYMVNVGLFYRPRCCPVPIVGVSADSEVAVLGGPRPVALWQSEGSAGVWPDRYGIDVTSDGTPGALVAAYRIVDSGCSALSDRVLGLMLVHEGALDEAAPLLALAGPA